MKRKIILYISCILTTIALCGCSDYLDKDPQNKQTNDSYWQSENSLRTYAQGFYSTYFTGYGTDYTTFGGYFSGDDYTDDFLTLGGGTMYFSTSSTTGWNATTSSWSNSYSTIYKANVMLEKIPDMEIDDEAKNHWEGIARFFRALAYSTLAKYYGGVPYFDAVTDPADENLYKDRDPYLYVAQKIQEDFQFALDNVREDDTKLQVNKYVVGAYMSREMLYHATWLKYHGSTVGPTSETIADADIKELLQGAINGAEVVMNSGNYSIGNTYNALFVSESLADNPEIIWYREYADGVTLNHLLPYNYREGQDRGSVTQDVIDSYLCTSGLPVGQDPNYSIGENGLGVFENRDPRLYQTIADSLRIMTATGTNYTEGASPTGYATKKFLNDEWVELSATDATYLSYVTSGNPIDAPCIRYAEVLLNYVEARYEISRVGGSTFTQDDLDKSINKIRARQLTKWKGTTAVTMPTITLSGSSIAVNGTVIDDPARDTEVDPILWEIRRERRVELIMEGRRGEDLRRWAKFEYLNSEDDSGHPTMTFLGAYVNLEKDPYTGLSPLDASGNQVLYLYDPSTTSYGTKGYIDYKYTEAQAGPIREFHKGELESERYYLRSIPASQLTIYADKGATLTQNPGW